jgi:hypothetical protein
MGSADRVHLHLHRVGGGRPLRCQRTVHHGADLGLKVSGTHHFRNRLVHLPGKRGGYLRLNGMPGKRRCSADADTGATAGDEAASGRDRTDEGQYAPLSFMHMVTLPRHIVPAYQALLTGPGFPPIKATGPGAGCTSATNRTLRTYRSGNVTAGYRTAQSDRLGCCTPRHRQSRT